MPIYKSVYSAILINKSRRQRPNVKPQERYLVLWGRPSLYCDEDF
jgi:hypothetical protein